MAINNNNFIILAHNAFFDGLFLRLVRLFEKNTRAYTFWSVWVSSDNERNDAVFLEVFAKKIQKIRNKFFVHIDKSKAGGSVDVWKEADIKSDDVNKDLKIIEPILSEKFRKVEGYAFNWTGSNGSERIKDIVSLYIENFNEKGLPAVSACGRDRRESLFIEKENRLFHWADSRNVPADNNRAERELRPTVIARKVSFGSHSAKAARNRSVLMSVLHTAVKRLDEQTIKQWLVSSLDKIGDDPRVDLYKHLADI